MMWNVYVRVDDADAIYAEVQERGAGIDYTIYDAPHGFREFGVQDPEGTTSRSVSGPAEAVCQKRPRRMITLAVAVATTVPFAT